MTAASRTAKTSRFPGQDEQISIAIFAAAWATSHDERTMTDPVTTQVDMRHSWADYYRRSGVRKL